MQLDQGITPTVNDETEAPDTALPGQSQPILVDAHNSQIGILIGTTRVYDQSGMPGKAYELVTHTGHIVALQPGGRIGGPNALYFRSKNCAGPPSLPVQHADMANALVPGYVFAYGMPPRLYVIGKQTIVEIIHTQSVSRASADGDVCEEIDLTGYAYSVEPNDAQMTGISKVQFDRVTVQMVPLDARQTKRGKRSFFKDFNIDTDQSPSRDLTLQQCSPGCDIDFLSNGICEPECSTSACGYDSDDCSAEEIEEAINYEESLCAPSCEPGDLGDGFCDKLCNNSACNYDEGDCKDMNGNQ